MAEKKRVYCLYRVSAKGQVEKDDIPMQKEYCREFAEAKSKVEHWKEELGNKKQKANELHKLYGKVMTWSELFDTCNMAEKR